MWGDQDESIPAEQRNHVISLLEQQNKTHKVRVYNAGQAFLNDTHRTYEPHAATEAYGELVAWFKQYLG